VDRADLVFVSGGDATLGARILDDSGASAWLREANARGIAMMGVSAGSIALGAWWADWHEDESGDEEDHLARTGLVRGIGAVPGHVFDTHNEEDDWDELRFIAKLCERRGETARFVGIPTGGALVFHGDGSMETVGNAPFVLGGPS
jgi:cyanophycinase-like exopeptidase